MADHIRNFSIIAHIDHGKSTLADRMLEMTGTIETRKMREQVLDRMELERERGITIKMQPVRMNYTLHSKHYVLNLIDTPGHVDFAYEVSRALTAVEGVVLLVDATQGVEAQTLSVLSIARSLGLVIVPVVSKIDAPTARTADIRSELALLLNIDESEVLGASGKTGEGVAEVLNRIVEKVPPPQPKRRGLQALVFDFAYSDHRGVIIYARIFNGSIKKGDALRLAAAKESFSAVEVGVLMPDESPRATLEEGEIGYIVTGIKRPGIATVGDTVVSAKEPEEGLPGYRTPAPVIWASVYPESQDDLVALRQSLERLHLSDSSLSYEEESSGVMGKGYRCGFLGMLHLEIVIERLRREFGLALIVTMPTTVYEVTYANGKVEQIYAPSRLPDDGQAARVREMWANVSIISPPEHIGGATRLLYEHEAITGDTETLPDGKIKLQAEMPLRELMRGFFDRLKSASSGYASLSYELAGLRDADVTRLDILVAEEPVAAFARIVSRRRVQEEAEKMVEKLEKLLPRQLFVLKIQAKAMGRIIAARRVSALRKDVTGYLYGGDVTRKMKLLEKQKKGKKKMLARGTGKVDIPHEVFLKVVREN
ncbi:elongation factor 4 [Candidatus Kaiserbacteria bacterium CG10_big_fil_rev_8_21_14_0_10_59_10]|uniref:Elongation factor 4 n=1 Tax=Candidatus Kaiserbacteria bacterium CG10_big_fil_rev_8_21_14_0_10_59_10 TaxID=1974612 RepID=A0A2H0U7S6_9BACT|nr:MAG: elongation factor 4 [Candidatus Kaiserbacteria bacterium CG10_big_fil_rev_8_21_14_0_10_59_10]